VLVHDLQNIVAQLSHTIALAADDEPWARSLYYQTQSFLVSLYLYRTYEKAAQTLFEIFGNQNVRLQIFFVAFNVEPAGLPIPDYA
jgi:hypothetical protein